MATYISLKDLAKRLGLAPSTVSRALKGHPDISQKTQEKVRQLAIQLNYTPDTIARNLRNQHSNLIAVIVPDITNYYFAQVLRGVLQHARETGYNVVIFETCECYDKEVTICRSICKSGIGGVMISLAKTTQDTRHFNEVKDCGIPLVFFDRIGGNIEADRVAEDNYTGAYQAVKHMINGGCRNIAHFAAPQYMQIAQKRQMGYIQALLDNQIPVNRELIIPGDERENAMKATFRLLEKQTIDGIFAVNDDAATGVMDALKQMKLRIPEDVAVCGYSNSPFSLITEPKLTTVDQHGEETGRIAAKLLHKRISQKGIYETETRLLKPTLMIRGSTREHQK